MNEKRLEKAKRRCRLGFANSKKDLWARRRALVKCINGKLIFPKFKPQMKKTVDKPKKEVPRPKPRKKRNLIKVFLGLWQRLINFLKTIFKI